jgi:ADP-L-glycero-D-manno-heptose 6-epimerase
MELHDDKYIILTGGAGFIGSNILRQLNDDGWTNIVVVDELGHSNKWKNLLGKRFSLYLDKDDLIPWLKSHQNDVEAVIHLGACSDTLEKDASYCLKNNYEFTIQLATLALNNDYRFIYASSAATYGDGSKGFSDSHDLLEQYEPLNIYGYSKHLFDLWAKQEEVLDQIVGLKFFNVFGPNEYHKGRMASAVTHFVEQAQSKGKIRLFKSNSPKFADGDQSRDFIYIKDVAKMSCLFLRSSVSGIFNIGRGVPGTWNQIAKSVIETIDAPAQIEYIEMPQDIVKQYQNYTCADMNKFRHAFPEYGNKSLEKMTTSLSEAVKEYVKEYIMLEKRW